MNFKLDFISADLAIELFQRLKEGQQLDETLINRYYNSPGIQFLRNHLHRYGGTILEEELFMRFFQMALLMEGEPSDDNIILKSIKRGLTHLDRWIEELAKLKELDFEDQVMEKINQFLPAPWTGKVTIYFLCGIRGTGIVMGKKIAIDICDEMLESEGHLDHQAFIDMMAHEVHHIACDEYFAEARGRYLESDLHEVMPLVWELLSEGMTTYYITEDFWTQTDYLQKKWKENLAELPAIVVETEEMLNKLLDGELLDYGTDLFDNQLKGYSLGYIICQTIDQVFGKEKIYECIKEPTLFLSTYNDAVRKDQLDLPCFSEQLLKRLAQ